MRVLREDVLACPCGGRRVVLLSHPVRAGEGRPQPPAVQRASRARPLHRRPAEATWQDDVPMLQQSLRAESGRSSLSFPAR